MATKRWVGGAPAVAKVSSWTFGGTWIIGETITLTIGSKAWVYTIASATIATFNAALIAAYNLLDATVYPEFAENTAAVGGTSAKLQLTADTAGKTFIMTLATNSASGTIGSEVAVTASAGPIHLDTAANWSDGANPGAADTVYIDASEDEITQGLDSLAAITLDALFIKGTFTGKIGLPPLNQDAVQYPEYRPRYLKIRATSCKIGEGVGQGSDRVYVDFSTIQTTCVVIQSQQGEAADREAVLLKGTHASNEFDIFGGQVGIAVNGGETSVVLTGRLCRGASLRCGTGVTLGTITNSGGTVELNSAIATALVQDGGQTIINGSGDVALITATINGGTIIYNTTGTLGGAPVLAGGLLDFDQDRRPKTVTNPIDLYGVGQVRDTYGVVNASGNFIVDYNQTFTPGQVLGSNWRLTRAATA